MIYQYLGRELVCLCWLLNIICVKVALSAKNQFLLKVRKQNIKKSRIFETITISNMSNLPDSNKNWLSIKRISISNIWW